MAAKDKAQSHWHIIDPVRCKIYVAMALSVLSVATSLVAVLLMAYVLRDLIANGHASWVMACGIIGLALAAYLLRAMGFKTSHRAAFALENILRTRISTRLSQVSLGFLSDSGAAALAKVMQDDVKDLHVFVADSTPLYARAYAAPLLTLLLLLWLDWRMALVALGVLVVGMALFAVVMRGSYDMSRQYNEAREHVNTAVIEFVQAMPVVRTFDGGETSFGRYRAALDRYLVLLVAWYRQNSLTARLSMTILNPMPTLLALLWAGIYWYCAGVLDFSVWLAVLLLGTGMAEALMPYMSLFHMIDKSKIAISRIEELLNAPLLSVPAQPQRPQDASVVFEQVCFCYPNRRENALDNISFCVPAGSFVALVGASGAGKSTVARLIPRFWDVSSGSVKVGGMDVRHILPETLMNHVAFVFQDNFLFSGSIADNIRLGQADADAAAVKTAAKAAQAHDFIMALSDGYDTETGERGAALSGGQRQRITIARAILQNRPILVLDEATAFADAENEALLMIALQKLMKNKTVLMIAHRLSTIRHADQILVFEQGRLAETGKHEDLLAQKGRYASLWQAYQTARDWRVGAENTLAENA